MADNKLYKLSIGMATVIATVTCGMTAPALAADTTPTGGNTTVATAPADPGKTDQNTGDTTAADKPAENTAAAKIGDTEYKTLADAVKAAKEGETILLTGHANGVVTLDKKITLQGQEGNQFNGRLIVTADGVTVKGVNFVFDASTPDMFKSDTKTGYVFNDADNRNGETVSQLEVRNVNDVIVEANTFTIDKTANPTLQLNAVRLLGNGDGVKNATVNGNTFNIAAHTRYLAGGKLLSQSWVAVNVHGSADKDKNAKVQDLKITNNTATITEAAELIPDDKLPEADKGKTTVGQTNFFVANGNEGDAIGVDGVAFTGNKLANKTGIDAAKSNLYGVTIAASGKVTVTNNTFEGLVAVAASRFGNPQAASTGLSYQGNTDDTNLGVFFVDGAYTGSVDYKDNTGTASSKLITTDKGSYLTWAEAEKASTDGKLTLEGDITVKDGIAVAKDKTLVVDLNGHKLTADFTNEGDLTLTDSKTTGSLAGKVTGKGKLTLTGGTYQFQPADGAVPAGYAVTEDKEAKTWTVVKLQLTVPNDHFTVTAGGEELTADSVIALTDATAPTGYEVIVPADDLKPINEAIKAGKKFDGTISLQLGKDGKPVDGVDPVTVTVHVVEPAKPGDEVTITVRSGELTVNAGDGQYTAAQLLEKSGATASAEAELTVNVDQLNQLNDAIATNKAGDYKVGLTAKKGEVTASSTLLVHVQAAALTATGFDWNVNDGELTADKVLELAKPAVSGSGYAFTVNADQLAELNKQVKAGQTGKVTLTITADGAGRPELVAAIDVNLTTKPVDGNGKEQDQKKDALAQTGATFMTVLMSAGVLAALAFGVNALKRRVTK